jgi:N-acetylmuramoyl-L-alanine amidase
VVLLVAAAVAGCSDGRSEAVAGRPVQATSTVPPSTAAPAPAGTVPATGPGVVVTPSGVVVPIVSDVDGGWVVTTPCGAERRISRGTKIDRADVVLDPGHGGPEPGAVSPGGLAEAPLNLDVARRAQAALEREGVSAVLTRTAEYQIGLPARARIATSLSPRAFVSIHHNAEPDGPHDGPGSETFYQQASTDSKRLAGLVQEEVFAALSRYDVPWVGDTDAGAKYRPGARGDYYGMLRLPATVPTVLAELAFISNPAEAALIARPEVQKVEGEAVARGIVRYLTTRDPGSGFTEPYPRPTPPGSTGGTSRGCRDPQL